MNRRAVLTAGTGMLLAGCAGRDRAPAGRTVIEFWCGWTGREMKVFQALVDRFNREQTEVWVHSFGGVQDDTKTIRAITAGVPPDAFFLWNPPYIGPLALNGALRRLDEMLPRAGLTEQDLVSVSLDLCRYRGSLYGLPVLIDATGLFWNRAAYREAGLDPDRPPRSPDEMIDYAKRLTKREGGQLVRIGFQPMDDLLQFLCACRAKLVDAQERPLADAPDVKAALTWYRDVIAAMGSSEEVAAFAAGFGQGQSANNPFFSGKTAMMASGEWNPFWIERYTPQLDYSVGPFPGFEPGMAPPSNIGGNVVVIPRESRHPEAAWKFIAWLQGRSAQLQFAHNIYNLPNRRDLLTDPTLTRGSRAARSYSVLLRLSASSNARAFPNTPYSSFYQTELTHARDFVVHGGKSVEQAAADLQRRVQREADSTVGAA
jgi:multiple sugar transport system substrate-binding protein